jgi:energy-coupling factor transporter transmembrane protein EcfT
MAAPFQYEHHDTPVHNLNPIARLVLFGSFLVVMQMYIDPIAKLPLIILQLLILRTAKVSVGKYTGFIAAACLGTTIAQAIPSLQMTNPALYKFYPPEWAARVLMPLTPAGTPILGRTALTPGTILSLFRASFNVTPTILTMAGLLTTTSTSEIVSVLSRINAPFPIIFVTTIGLRFVPDIVAKLNLIMKAQTLRGWTSEGRNPIRKIKQLQPVFTPLIRYVIQSVDIISIGCKNRAFGFGPVTMLADFAFSKRDKIVCVVCVIAVVVLLSASLIFHVGNL